jgi:hypothetical protein
MEYKIPLIVLCPLNRNAVDNLPQISDLSESGSIEYDSDRIILLYEDKKDSDYEERRRGLKCEQKNLVTIDVAKNRRGALHKFDMIFDFGKAAVILQKKIIKPFKLARYADFELSTLEQIQRVPKDMQNHILNLVSEKSYEGNFLPWLDLLTPEVSVDEMETSNWKEFLASLAV